jgi:hypothetical protein
MWQIDLVAEFGGTTLSKVPRAADIENCCHSSWIFSGEWFRVLAVEYYKLD